MQPQRYLCLLLTLLAWSIAPACASTEPSAVERCDAERVQLQMLGTRGPELIPGDDQASTSYLIRLDGKAKVIVDAGPGSLQNFKKSGAAFNDVDVMLFTHFHVDHSADFPAYIKTAFFSQRDKDLYVYGPDGGDFVTAADDFVARALSNQYGMFPYLGNVLNPDANSPYHIISHAIPWSFGDLSVRDVHDGHGLKITAVPSHHGPFPAHAFRVDIAGCSIGFTGDMSGRLGAVPGLFADIDILVAHFAIAEDATGIPANLHMKPSTIGKIAAESRAKQLLLTHLMKRSLAARDSIHLSLLLNVPHRRLNAGTQLQFPQQVLHVDLHRPFGDAQLSGDEFIALTRSDEFQNALLLISEAGF